MALVFVHRFSLSQKVLSENLDFLVGHFQCFFPHSEALLQFRQSCKFRLETFGFSVDPILFGLDVLCLFSSGH